MPNYGEEVASTSRLKHACSGVCEHELGEIIVRPMGHPITVFDSVSGARGITCFFLVSLRE